MSNPLLLKNSTQTALPDNTVQPSTTPSLDYTTFGQNWLQTTAVSGNWSAIGSSANGQYVSACINPGAIYVSNNYGASWTTITTTNGVSANSLAWTGIALSASGQYQVATIGTGLIYRSTNFGVTWASTASSLAWSAVAISSSGVYVTAVVNGGQIWYSTDYGVTWTAILVANGVSSITLNWSAITMSATGGFQVATINSGLIYYSNNFGLNWTASAATGAYTAVGMSSSGQYVTAVAGPNVISSSSDYGKTWTTQSATFAWQAVAVSSSGQYQIVAGGTGGTGVIYYSTNYGTTWITSTNSYNIKCATMSHTGQYVMVAVNGALMYCATTRTPGLFTNGNVVIGTAAPNAKFHLDGGSTTGLNAVFYASGITAGQSTAIAIGKSYSASNCGTILWNHVGDASTSNYLGLGAFGADNKLNILANGNVGIGTNAPAYTLDVNGNARVSGSIIANTAYVSGSSSSLNSGILNITNTNTNPIVAFSVLGPNATENVSILFGNSATVNNSFFMNHTRVGVGSTTNYFSILAYGLQSGNGLNITAGGNVGIGTNAPAYTLDVNGSARIGSNSKIYVSGAGGFPGENCIVLNANPNSGYSSVSISTGHSPVSDRHILKVTGANGDALSVRTDGYVAIGGNMYIAGALSKGSGTFDIEHPLYPNTNKRLIHSFIEGPRCDLIYRGTTILNNGVATVYIDKQCTYSSADAMDEGTFEALCANPDLFLQNRTGFNRVIGSIQGAILTITCENSTSTDTISWMVVAERKDTFIKEWDRTDSNGYLITQYDRTK